jgi:hypothetical protein
MKRALTGLALTAVLVLALAAPAFAATGAEYGAHHAEHAVNEGGFVGDHNPGVMHKGFSGWMAE